MRKKQCNVFIFIYTCLLVLFISIITIIAIGYSQITNQRFYIFSLPAPVKTCNKTKHVYFVGKCYSCEYLDFATKLLLQKIRLLINIRISQFCKWFTFVGV